MRLLFRFPKLPYTLVFHFFFLVSQKSVMGNKASSLSTNRARSSFFKAFFLKLFFFLIRFCSSSGIMATSGNYFLRVCHLILRVSLWRRHYFFFAFSSSTLGIITLEIVLLTACSTVERFYIRFWIELNLWDLVLWLFDTQDLLWHHCSLDIIAAIITYYLYNF